MNVEEIRIRPYDEKDAPEIVRLFYETIRSVNLADYSQEQVEAWQGDPDSGAHPDLRPSRRRAARRSRGYRRCVSGSCPAGIGRRAGVSHFWAPALLGLEMRRLTAG